MPKSSQTKRRFTRKNSAKMSRKYRKRVAMWGGEEPVVPPVVTATETKPDNSEVVNASKDEIFKSDKISTQPCNNRKYKEIGIIHMSESIAVNLVRDATSDLFNVFGAKGFDNSIYDQLRNTCFQKLQDSITANQKICNVRVDIERDKSLIFMHVYGTLMENKNMSESVESSVESPVVDESHKETTSSENETDENKEEVEKTNVENNVENKEENKEENNVENK